MYRSIIVPLDGSKLAECVLSHVEDIAKGCGTEEVILVRVTERLLGRMSTPRSGYSSRSSPQSPLPPRDRRRTPLDMPIPTPALTAESAKSVPLVVGKKQSQAQDYLDRITRRIANRLEKEGIKVRAEVLLGNPAEEIISFAEYEGADLILIASHGRSGVSKWLSGSIAEKVFRASHVPVLIVKAPGLSTVEKSANSMAEAS